MNILNICIPLKAVYSQNAKLIWATRPSPISLKFLTPPSPRTLLLSPKP